VEFEQFQRILASENIAIRIYNFSTFGRGETSMYDSFIFLPRSRTHVSFKYNIRCTKKF